MINQGIIEEFDTMMDADNPDGFRHSTNVQPRLLNGEKVRTWLISVLESEPDTLPELLEALKKSIPLLELLGNYIGNGKTQDENSLGERCDVILSAKKIITKTQPEICRT